MNEKKKRSEDNREKKKLVRFFSRPKSNNQSVCFFFIVFIGENLFKLILKHKFQCEIEFFLWLANLNCDDWKM